MEGGRIPRFQAKSPANRRSTQVLVAHHGLLLALVRSLILGLHPGSLAHPHLTFFFVLSQTAK